jgi:hypothetical protein
MAGLAVPTFSFGGGAQARTPQEAARLRQTTAALMARMSTPQNVGQGLGAIGNALVVNALNDRAAAGETAGQAHAADLLKTLQAGTPSQADLVGAVSDPWVAANPGESAVAQALLQRQMDASDPDSILKRQYTQAQIDALKAKPAQPLINAGSGSIYDPNTQTWISEPTSTASGAGQAAPVTFTDAGVPNPDEQAAFLKSLDPDTAALVKGIADYQLDPTKTTSMRSDQRQKMIALVQQYDPTFDMSQYGARAQAKKAYTTGQQGQTITSANTVIGHLANLADDASKLGNGDFMPLNAVSNAVKGAFSNADLSKFNSDKKAVASELAKFFKGTGATDLTTTEEWQGIFDQNTGPGALKAVVQNVVANLMKSRLDEMRSQYTAAMGKPADFKFITPETESVLKKLGLKASDLDPGASDAASPPDAGAGAGDQQDYPEGTVIEDGTGKRLVLKGGQWVPVQ